MKIHIETGDSGRREIWAVRDDGAAMQIARDLDPAALPHDLFHYVVEDAVDLEWGFWDCVARGAYFPSMAVRGGITDRAARERSAQVGREAGTRADAAEFFVAAVESILDSGLESDLAAARALVRRQWPDLECPPLEIADLPAIMDRVATATKLWEALTPGENLIWPWPSPRSGSLRRGAAAAGDVGSLAG